MKLLTRIILIGLILLFANNIYSQCSCSVSAGTKQYPNSTFTPTSSWQTVSGIWGGNYTLFNVTSGNTYIWSYCSADGGSASWDTRINIYRNDNHTYLACNSDYCGLQSRITWTATFTGVVRVITNTYINSSNPCGTNQTNATLAYKMSGIASLPDLTINASDVTPKTLSSGEKVNLECKIKNIGSGSASSSLVSCFFSTNDTYQSGIDTWIADNPVPTLSAGVTSSTIYMNNISIPSVSAGNYFILFIANGGNNPITESNSGNNLIAQIITIQSLQYGSLSVNLSPQGAINNGAKWRLDGGSWRNSGYTQGNILFGPHNLEFKDISGYTAPSSKVITINSSNVLNETGEYSAIQSASISCNVSSLNYSTCTSQTESFVLTNTGSADLIVQPIVDVPNHFSTDLNSIRTLSPNSSTSVYVNFSPNGIAGNHSGSITIESNATNGNLNVNLLGICTKPDLTITNVSTDPATTAPGGSIRVNFTLNNIGNGNAPSSVVSFHLSADQIFTSGIDPYIDEVNLSALGGNNNIPSSYDLKIPNNTNYGQYYIVISADGDLVIDESNNENNSAYSLLVVSNSLPLEDTYPYRGDDNSPCINGIDTEDTWMFYKFECVSYVAWKVNEFWGSKSQPYEFYNSITGTNLPGSNCSVITLGSRLSHACFWDDRLGPNNGIPNFQFAVNNTPSVGSIAHWNPGDEGYWGDASSKGHVAFVNYYDPQNGDFIVTEYNTKGPLNNSQACSYNIRKLNMNLPVSETLYLNGVSNPNKRPGRFIHIEAGGKGGGGSTGIPNSLIGDMQIYPNPSNGLVHVKLNSDDNDLSNISVYNLMGNKVYETEWLLEYGENEREFDIYHLPNGVYFFILQNRNIRVSQYFILHQ